MTVLTSWTAIDVGDAVEGGRDLLGMGAIADQLAAEVAPNLRAGTTRARYYTMLAVGTHIAGELARSPSERLRHLFRWERLWLVAQFECHASKHDTLPALRKALDAHERDILGKGVGARSLRAYLEIRERGGAVNLDAFVPLEAPQTSGVYGRYAGSARDSGILTASGPLALDRAGDELVAHVEEHLGDSKFMARVREALEARRCDPRAKVCLAVTNLSLRHLPKRSERAVLAEALVEREPRTLLAATVLRQVTGTRADAPPWPTAIPRCASIARKHGSDGEALADTLQAIAAYDGIRTALELLLHRLNEALTGAWSASIVSLAADANIKKAVEAITGAAAAFLASPDVPATGGLRALVSRSTSIAARDAIELVCAQHAEVCARRGIGPWFRTRANDLELLRRPSTSAPSGGIGRYRLNSLESLIADLQWGVAS
jgi:hypothetical protein